MAISSMQQPRQMYGLGSFVKKFTRPLKKIVKSPLGKAALLGGGAYLLGGGRFGLGTGDGFGSSGIAKYLKGGLGNFMKGNAGTKMGSLSNIFRQGGKQGADFSMARLGLGGLGLAATTLPFLAGGEEDEDVITDPFSTTPSSISDIVSMAQNKDPSLRFMPNSQYVQKNFYKAADGGIAKLSMGGGAGQQQMMQALQAEYMKYRQNGGTMPFEQYAKMVMQQQGQPQMAAEGGRIGYSNGGLSTYQIFKLKELGYDTKGGKVLDPFGGEKVLKDILKVNKYANGGRIGYAEAGPVMEEDVEVINEDTQQVASNNENDRILELLFEKYLDMGMSMEEAEAAARMELDQMSQGPAMEETMVEDRVMANAGGMMDYMSSANPMADSYLMEDTDIVNMYRPGGDRQPAAEGGIMDLGGMEKDYRAEGGFVPIGGQEKADDVPARLSKNEFVFTADAVRNAGGGDIDAGAEVMENMMNHLEQGGQVSEESQGGNPAQEMFDTAQQLESRIA